VTLNGEWGYEAGIASIMPRGALVMGPVWGCCCEFVEAIAQVFSYVHVIGALKGMDAET